MLKSYTLFKLLIMEKFLIPIVITLHFIFDWILQPRSIAEKKGLGIEGVDAVIVHFFINIIPFSIVVVLLLNYFTNLEFNIIIDLITINGITHIAIDILLPKGRNMRQKINLTALDQILHLTILIGLIENM